MCLGPVGVLGDVDFARRSRGLGAARQVHRVAEEAVARHALTNHSRHHFTTMDTDGDLLRRTKRPPSASRHSIGPSLRSPHYSPPALHRPGRPRPVPSCPGPDGRCIALGRGTLLVDR